jgi:hypothetical protein
MSDEPDSAKWTVGTWAIGIAIAFAVYFCVHCGTAHQIWMVDGATGRVMTVHYTHNTLGLLPSRWVNLFFWPAEQLDRIVRRIPTPKR